MSPQVLLLQARHPHDPMGRHEHECFAVTAGLDPDDITPFDLLERCPTLEEIQHFDALMVGGSGDFYVTKRNLPRFDELLDLFRRVVEVGHPTFASCFGYQCLVAALGGELIHDPDATEVGTFELELTEEGQKDPLFGELPRHFNAQLGRKDRAMRHPESVPNLARSERSPFQALRIPDRPIWGTQFHPELDRQTNQDRYQHYLDGYAKYLESEELDRVSAQFQESPEVSKLLGRFLELVLDGSH